MLASVESQFTPLCFQRGEDHHSKYKEKKQTTREFHGVAGTSTFNEKVFSISLFSPII